jgi:hypothetical protein
MTITEESPLALHDQTDWTVMQGTHLIALNAGMRALEADLAAEVNLEGHLVMLAAATAAGIDITALGWLESQLA